MRRALVLTISLLAVFVKPAGAWWPEGHGIVARAALKALPSETPPFFREGGDLVAHLSFDPDVAKNRQAPNLRNAEEPEHYLDLELLNGTPLPATRYVFLKLCAERKLDPDRVGLVPYAVTEWTERLAVAFAEHRKWPDNPHIRTKCLLYAGILAHYAGDMSQPLHTTIHHDGRAKPDGGSPRSGIHTKVDALIERLELKPEEVAAGLKVEPAAKLMPAINDQIRGSHALVERVYQLEPKLPPTEGPLGSVDPEVVAFAKERGRESARFLASLYLTAWRKSAAISLPPWLRREGTPAKTSRGDTGKPG